MIFMLDNYDSFTYNLVHMVASLGLEVEVRRNREVTPDQVLALGPEAIILSPGPGRPQEAGCLMGLVEKALGRIPLLGVCLGHQAIGAALGARVIHAKSIMHGKTSPIRHDGKGLFQGLPQDFLAVRYHSLALERCGLPPEVVVSAQTEGGEVMGVRRAKPGEAVVEGIQYHPESILSQYGKEQLLNFLKGASIPC